MARSRLIDRGNEIVRFYVSEKHVDRQGNEVMVPSGKFYDRRATVAEERQSDAELPGQVAAKIVRLVVRDAPALDSWAEVHFRGERWDLAAPPHFSNGVSRAIRHVELMLRSRNDMETGVRDG